MSPAKPLEQKMEVPTGIHYVERVYSKPGSPGVKFYAVHVKFGGLSQLVEIGTDGTVEVLTGNAVTKDKIWELFNAYRISPDGERRLEQLEFESKVEIPE